LNRRVLVAMSGGVDSSVAAALLVERGFSVVGVAMRLAPDIPVARPGQRGTCCSHEDFEDARRVAEQLRFPFYVVDLRADFGRQVIEYFVTEYLRARTPNPCVMCNREIKFDRLWDRARAIQADFIATGHYARIERDRDGELHLLRAVDQAKDQSYFLFHLGQRELVRTLFPLGELTKTEVRERARVLGLINADKPESQEICFVPDGDYAGFVERSVSADRLRAGKIVDGAGRVLNTHPGIHRFTVGQRRGLGISAGEPLYVHKIDSETAEVRVGARSGLVAAGLIATRVSLARLTPAPGGEFEAEVKVRYRHPGIPARVRLLGPDEAEVRFHNGGPGVTPGQACVFYRGDEVIGGGFIQRALEL
jgi:tRNA-specific 2-thiouridylase